MRPVLGVRPDLGVGREVGELGAVRVGHGHHLDADEQAVVQEVAGVLDVDDRRREVFHGARGGVAQVPSVASSNV